ncbi:ubiquinone/menaquinone biosynthesis C-methylase UbiE [Bradyrhizobium sp. IAR9]|uniref:class I SAM-dependent methyltransferase n=1 Tax=Bradyrhizobium sp. IAR9 TaxID=2663841 RepID=UPI0015C9A62C|nr:class I SAM-dependent methyltransferase [Bradyrhizobium sp. IAR9]NYG45482.1 ubiquinone/menaquinone biosynthesis C-methylase UbiE [Bradyrhizobium sp. IAR9]
MNPDYATQAQLAWRDFDGLGHFYQFRPEYPPRIARQLRSMLGDSAGGHIIEVGAGTGHFTRSLAAVFGPSFTVLALEPNEDMRRHAETSTPTRMSITYADGVAERLPVENASAQLIAAASAAHRFDRPLFFQEVRRVLEKDGLLAFIQYQPYDKGGSFADRFLSIIETALPGYDRHWSSKPEGGYFEFDIVAELQAEAAVKDVQRDTFLFSEIFDWERFKQQALSFTTVQRAIGKKGNKVIVSELSELFDQHQSSDKRVEMPFEVEIITARRV